MSYGGNQAIDQLSNFAIGAALAIQNRRLLIVHRFGVKLRTAGEQSSQLDQVLLVACTSKHFHSNWVRDANLASESILYALPYTLVPRVSIRQCLRSETSHFVRRQQSGKDRAFAVLPVALG